MNISPKSQYIRCYCIRPRAYRIASVHTHAFFQIVDLPVQRHIDCARVISDSVHLKLTRNDEPLLFDQKRSGCVALLIPMDNVLCRKETIFSFAAEPCPMMITAIPFPCIVHASHRILLRSYRTDLLLQFVSVAPVVIPLAKRHIPSSYIRSNALKNIHTLGILVFLFIKRSEYFWIGLCKISYNLLCPIRRCIVMNDHLKYKICFLIDNSL